MTPKERSDTVRERVQAIGKLDPTVPIILKGKTYTLEYNNASVRGILEQVKVNLLQSGLSMADLADPEKLNVILYYGLVENHPDITTQEVDRILDLRRYAYISGQIREALNYFMPDLSDLPPLEPVAKDDKDTDPTKLP